MTTTTYTSSSPSPLTKEWLSLPRDLAIDDSFADDLIRQFDKKRTGLHKDNQYDQQSEKSQTPLPTRTTSLASNPTPINQPPLPRLNRISTRTSSRTSSMIINTPSPPLDTDKNLRRSSAGDLLRRSSAFFKATLDQTWKNISRSSNENQRSKGNQQQHEQNDDDTDTPSLPATVAINTTITLPITKKTSQSSFPPLQPPVISQYPPKPLQYSPVTPTDSSTDLSTSPSPNDANGPRQKTLIHRISMPALRRRVSNFSNNNNNNDQQQSTSSTSYRRKSDSANPFFLKRKKPIQP